MKSSSEITAKLVAATLLTGVFSLSQTEACEGIRKNAFKEIRLVATEVGAAATSGQPPVGFIDTRVEVSGSKILMVKFLYLV
ncbi:MAG: hypothetical protein IPK04_01305 [Bdellovibrionales bacterium]|nr:hypothetical protein [Bdellovibrionales bacterium]